MHHCLKGVMDASAWNHYHFVLITVKKTVYEEKLTCLSSVMSAVVIHECQGLSSRIFSTRGNRSVQPVLYWSLSIISAAFIYGHTYCSCGNSFSDLNYHKIKIHLCMQNCRWCLFMYVCMYGCVRWHATGTARTSSNLDGAMAMQ